MQFLNSVISGYGVLGYFIAMILQAAIAPIPGEVIMMSGGAIFGVLTAGIIGEIGGCIGATLCFLISKKGGRPLVTKFISKKSLDFADEWFKKHGVWAVLLARLIPFIPVDAVSYGAGLTAMSFKVFISATAIGMLPRVFFYAYLGELAAKQIETIGIEKAFMDVLVVLILILTVIFACIYLFKKMRSKADNKE